MAQKDSAMRAPIWPVEQLAIAGRKPNRVAASQGRVNPSHVQVKLVDEVVLRIEVVLVVLL